jgi:hypothetical protein
MEEERPLGRGLNRFAIMIKGIRRVEVHLLHTGEVMRFRSGTWLTEGGRTTVLYAHSTVMVAGIT